MQLGIDIEIDWQKIANYVGDKTRKQVKQFWQNQKAQIKRDPNHANADLIK